MSDPAKKDLSERDICTKFITPALTAGNKWDVSLKAQMNFEQKRIVTKAEELMRWCDALEARLTPAQTTTAALLDATLHRILAA